jgi:hypothetical protein
MESILERLSSFQIYCTGNSDDLDFMVDRLWIKNNRVFFRVVEGNPPREKGFRKENGLNVFSINKEDFISIRCRLYF